MIIVERTGQDGVEKRKIDSGIELVCFFPGKIFAGDFARSVSYDFLASEDRAAGWEERLGWIDIDSLVSDTAIAEAEFQIVHNLLAFHEIFFRNSPADGNGREKCPFVSRRKTGWSVVTGYGCQQITIVIRIVDTSKPGHISPVVVTWFDRVFQLGGVQVIESGDIIGKVRDFGR